MRLIDADALMDDVSKRYCEECEKRRGIKKGKQTIIYEIGDAPCRACSVDDMKSELETAQTIEERKKGKWIDETFKPWGLVFHPYKCDQCGEHSEADSDFCPNCGAKMEATS